MRVGLLSKKYENSQQNSRGKDINYITNSSKFRRSNLILYTLDSLCLIESILMENSVFGAISVGLFAGV